MVGGFGRVAVALVIAGFAFSGPAVAQQNEAVTFSTQTASVTYGPYARFGLGLTSNDFDNARWQNGGGDPTISFGLTDETAGYGELAVGFDWQNGFRADLAFSQFGVADATGPCIGTSNATLCSDHADISGGTISSRTVMGNVYYAPFEASGNNSTFQPFVTAGAGFALNRVGVWTRSANPGSPSPRPLRSFESNTDTSFAWSLGLGAAWQVTRPGQHPVLVEASWRYFDLGEASGGAAPLPGNGAGAPIVPLTFDNSRQVFSISIRIPLQRL